MLVCLLVLNIKLSKENISLHLEKTYKLAGYYLNGIFSLLGHCDFFFNLKSIILSGCDTLRRT